jgi:hypothetical protein
MVPTVYDTTERQLQVICLGMNDVSFMSARWLIVLGGRKKTAFHLDSPAKDLHVFHLS